MHPSLRLITKPIKAVRNFFIARLAATEHQRFEEAINRYFSLVKEGSLVVEAPKTGMLVEFDFRSHALQRLLRIGRYENHIVDLIHKFCDPLRDFMDVGANVGFHTLVAASLLRGDRTTVAVEPTNRMADLLERNLSRNNLNKNVIIERRALSNREGEAMLHIVEGREEYSSLNEKLHQAAGLGATASNVAISTLDQVRKTHNLNLGMIKIDVEGAECLVLEGAACTLQDQRPVLLIEVSDVLLTNAGTSSENLFQFLSNFGYLLRDAARPNEEALSPFEGDIIAVHQSEKGRL